MKHIILMVLSIYLPHWHSERSILSNGLDVWPTPVAKDIVAIISDIEASGGS